MSRVTLYRIESGLSSVTIGAYANAAAALGMQLSLRGSVPDDPVVAGATPAPVEGKVRVGDYPQLRALCWQLHGDTELSRQEALHRYEREWRHVDHGAMTDRERFFIQQLADECSGVVLLV